jgi:hypothetical protein
MALPSRIMILARLFQLDNDVEQRIEIDATKANHRVSHDGTTYRLVGAPRMDDIGRELWEELAFPAESPDTFRVIFDYQEEHPACPIP